MRFDTVARSLHRLIRLPENLPESVKSGVILAVCVALSGAMEYHLGYRAYLLVRWQTAIAGVTAGICAATLLGAAHAVALVTTEDRHRAELLNRHQAATRSSPFTVVHRALAASCGVELLLRAHLFGYLMLDHLWWALLINAAVSGSLHWIGHRSRTGALIEVLRASFFAMVFLAQRSVFVLAVAGLFEYLIASTLIRSAFLERWLSQGPFTWKSLFGRTLYELGTHPHQGPTLRV